MYMSHIGQLSDLIEVKSKSGTKIRYNCPYCDVIHGKRPDTKGCFSYDIATLSGWCFKCHSQVIHDGLRDLKLIADDLQSETQESEWKEANEQKLRLTDWTSSILDNPKALMYMEKRGFSKETLTRFNIRACNEPSLGVIFPNKIINNEYTDFYQVRYVDFYNKHSMLKSLHKKCNWLHIADTPRLIIVEGFSSGLAAYQHSLKWKEEYLNPIIICGNSMTRIQLRELKEFCANYDKTEIYVCLDGGFYENGLKIAKNIYQKCSDVDIYMTYLHGDTDPNDLETWEFLSQIDKSYYYEPNRLQYIRSRVYNR